MLSFAHTIISLPFAIYLNNPVIIFVSAAVFHIFLDTLLHWNIFPDDYKKFPYHIIIFDVLGGLLAAWLLVGNQLLAWPFIIAIAGGNAPDIISTLWIIIAPTKYRKLLAWTVPFFTFHDHLQIETHNIKKGLISQLAFVLLAVYLIL